MSTPDPRTTDLTPESASPTDVAPLGRLAEKPAHEMTAEEDSNADWNGIAKDPDFISLVKRKARFIIPATVFFILYYFALPVGVGWFPKFMEKRVIGDLNIAYLFALSQFFMAWILAFLYVAAAAGWDRQAAALLKKFNCGEGR